MSESLQIPAPVNEPVRSFAPGTAERESLKKALGEASGHEIEIPLLIGGKEVRTGQTSTARMPHRHGHVLATWHKAGPNEVNLAIRAAAEAHRGWAASKFEDRARIFLRAA